MAWPFLASASMSLTGKPSLVTGVVVEFLVTGPFLQPADTDREVAGW